MRGLFGTIADGLDFKAVDVSNLTWQKLFGEDVSVKSGVSVSVDSALRVSTVLACARVIAEGVAQLPFKLYRERADGGKDPAKDHKLYRLISRRPNPWMTSFELRELLTIHAVLTGNGYAFINRLGGEVRELIPLLPSRVQVTQSENYDVVYEVSTGAGEVLRFSSDRIFHLRGPSWNGYLGMDAVQMAREAIGLAIATEETHARLHSNGARPGGVLSTDKELGETSYRRLKEQWGQHREGLANAFKTAVLDGGMKWSPMAMTGVDNQHIETRKYQVEEICRALRVMPVMLSHPADIAARAAMEQLFIAHVVHSLMPWLVRWEQAVDRDLVGTRAGSEDLFAKFTVAGLMRGALRDQGEYFAKSLGSGGSPAWLTQNEVRTLLEFNPLPGGDELPKPTNPATPSANAGDDEGEDEDGK